jgi:acyl-CoA thioester hydrolase
MRTHEARLRVRYAETDQMGVVYHANYLIWMEVGRVEYCRAAGLRYRDLEADGGIRLAVVEANCRFLSPARYDEEILVKTWIEDVNRRMVRFVYEMRNADDSRLLATGFTKHIFLGSDMRPRKLPETYGPVFGV